MDNLPQLRDIHLPLEGVSMFPPAYGWWVILFSLILAIIAYYLIRLAIQKSKKRYALRLLANEKRPNLNSAVKMSEILRRICVYKYQQAATIYGQTWIDFLNHHAKKKISGKTAQLLLDAPYINYESKTYSAEDIMSLYNFCKSWIEENL